MALPRVRRSGCLCTDQGEVASVHSIDACFEVAAHHPTDQEKP